MEIKLKNYCIVFSAETKTILDYHIQRNLRDNERGGIILGKVLNNKIHLLKLSIPTELDKASRTNFERNRVSAQIVVDYEHFNSNNQITYLGEWHTHPEDNPTPSNTDIKMINQQYVKNKIHEEFLILLIQGRQTLYVGVLDKDGLISTSCKF